MNFTKLSSEFDQKNYDTEYIIPEYPDKIDYTHDSLESKFNSMTTTSSSNASQITITSSTKSDSTKKHETRDEVWAAVTESALNATAHGLPNIFRLENKFLKLMWIVFFLCSFGYCIYTISLIILSFISFDVLTNQQVVNVSPVDYPAVTVCNINPFDRRNAQTYIDAVLLKNNISYVNDIKKACIFMIISTQYGGEFFSMNEIL